MTDGSNKWFLNFAGISSAAAALYGAESVLEISLEMTRHFVESDDEELLIKRFFFISCFFPIARYT